MKYLKIITLGSLIAFSGGQASAQYDDPNNVALTVFIPGQVAGVPAAAEDILVNKLGQLISQNNMSNNGSSRFIITARINELSKDILPGPPATHAYNLNITFYIGDGVDGRKFASRSVEVKCAGVNETKAYIDGIKKIKVDDPAMAGFVSDGRQKIIDYYNANCGNIIREAQVLASQQQYEEAIFRLGGVPYASDACYANALSAMRPIYKKYMERQCNIKLAEARNSWAASQNMEGANAVAGILSSIDPEADCYREATALSQEIAKRIREVDKREWDFKMKQFDAKVAADRALVQAYRDVATSFINTRPQTVYNVRGWW